MIDGRESAGRKLIRAQNHIDAIRDLVWEYTEREPSTVTKQSDGSHRLNFIESPPDAISILSGEAIYQIRSALDHLAFQLVQLNRSRITLPLDWDEKCAFPLRVKPPRKPPIFNCFEGTLPGITTQAFTFIEGLQPYNRTDVGVYLGRLALLSNIDKHRHINVIKPQAHERMSGEVIYKGHPMNVSHVARIEDGAQVDLGPSPYSNIVEVNVSRGFHPFVSFFEPILDPGVPAFSVDGLLQACLDRVEQFIIPAFVEFLK